MADRRRGQRAVGGWGRQVWAAPFGHLYEFRKSPVGAIHSFAMSISPSNPLFRADTDFDRAGTLEPRSCVILLPRRIWFCLLSLAHAFDTVAPLSNHGARECNDTQASNGCNELAKSETSFSRILDFALYIRFEVGSRSCASEKFQRQLRRLTL
jgi:hypothetical protein